MASGAKMEAAAAAAASSAEMKPPARRGWTLCSRVPDDTPVHTSKQEQRLYASLLAALFD